jgi:Intracellular proteinase inhibitor
MMARLALLVGIVLGTAGAQYRCSSDGSGLMIGRDLDSGHGPAFSTTLVLRDSAGTVTYSFNRMEIITLEITVLNLTDTAMTVHLPSTAGSEFMVFADSGSTPRWRSNDGKVFLTIVTDLVFQPRESRIFSLDWNQEMGDGSFLPKGTYEARGMLPNVGFPADPLAANELGSNLKAFTVR